MIHPPWVSASDDAVQSSRYQPAVVLERILSAFKAEGGSEEALCELLNAHMPAAGYNCSPADLIQQERLYSLEFYFYFFTFCKLELDDPYFHYSNAGGQLDAQHYIVERGYLEYSPWSGENIRQDGYLPMTTIGALFIYLEEAFSPAEGAIAQQTGKELAKEILAFINLSVEEQYRVERFFFNKEEILVSPEYLSWIISLFVLLTNDVDLISRAYTYGTLHSHHLAKAVFMLPGKKPGSKITEWVQRTNSVYEYDYKVKIGSFEIRIDAKKLADLGFFGRYTENCFCILFLAIPAIYSSYIEMAQGKTNRYKVIYSSTNPYSITIKYKLGNPIVFFGKLFVFLGFCAASGFFIQNLSNRWFTPLVFTIIFSVIAGFILIILNKHRSLKKRFEKTKILISTQLDSLKETTNDLLAERDALDNKVTERTAELHEALEQLKELDRAKTNFIANVSHELRTPLTLVSVPLEEIITGRYGDELSPDHQVFSLIDRNVKRLNNQINQLLDFARLDLCTIPFNPHQIEIAGYCRLLIAELDSLAERKGLFLKIENRTDSDEVIISADERMLETMLLNLLNNALKFTDKGGVTLSLSAESADDSVRLCVEDTGIGFPSEQKARLFQRFTQAEESGERKREGAGLGLALVNEIAELHGWELDADGCPGEGSVFAVKIPLIRTNTSPGTYDHLPDEGKAARQELAGSGLSPDAGSPSREFSREKETILIVEDNSDMGTVIQGLLEEEFNIKWCTSGHAALEWLGTHPQLALIICDVMMPGMNGFRFREELLKNNDYYELPFIYLTALADQQEKNEGLKSGAVDYIKKPFTVSELVLKVRNLIETHKASYLQAVRDQSGMERLARLTSDLYTHSPGSGWNLYGITDAEKRVIELVRLGLQDKEIASELSISVRTVSSHLNHLYQKTDTQNRVELINLLYK